MKATITVVAAALVALLVTAMVAGTNSTSGTNSNLVRSDSHRLSTAADGKVTVVEFLDFECEYCGAAYPGVERLRAEYSGKITYVVRYFPIASHRNANNAARAAEAAARQGKFEPMYKKLFDNQKQWGEKEDSQAALFESFADELGLNITKFRADVVSNAVAARVKVDSDDGQAAGVQGTPSFFINGKKLEGEPNYDTLKAAVRRALAA